MGQFLGKLGNFLFHHLVTLEVIMSYCPTHREGIRCLSCRPRQFHEVFRWRNCQWMQIHLSNQLILPLKLYPEMTANCAFIQNYNYRYSSVRNVSFWYSHFTQRLVDINDLGHFSFVKTFLNETKVASIICHFWIRFWFNCHDVQTIFSQHAKVKYISYSIKRYSLPGEFAFERTTSRARARLPSQRCRSVSVRQGVGM